MGDHKGSGDAASPALRAAASGPLRGAAAAPGDKSISHRAVLFGAMAEGETHIDGLLEAEDVLRTAAAARELGAVVEREREDGRWIWRVRGAPWRELGDNRALYFGNAGTGVRLMMGAVAGRRIAARFDGDASLRARPMGRVAEPLRAMGAKIELADGRLPASVDGSAGLTAIDYVSPTPSAQVKSAVLLAALGADGVTRFIEPAATRDHTERLLPRFNVAIETSAPALGREQNAEPGAEPGAGAGGRTLALKGGQRLTASDVVVPGDPSSAAFLAAAAAITPGSDVLIRNVLVNPLRAGFFDTMKEMGADLTYENEREVGEPIADIRVRHAPLTGVAAPASRAPSMIDEYPILSVVAAYASGDTYMPGVEELRVKETDRIDAVVAMLTAAGVETEAGPDWLRVVGRGSRGVPGGALVETRLDHRIAMSALVLGLGAQAPVGVDDAAPIATSFPTFAETLVGLGADISA